VSARTLGAFEWLSVCRHRVRRIGVPYLLILQHHIVQSDTRIVAPVLPAAGRPAQLLVPHVHVASVPHRVMLLNMVSVATALLGEQAEDAEVDVDTITDALDAIFRCYPVGLPFERGGGA
jgi:CcdB protein